MKDSSYNYPLSAWNSNIIYDRTQDTELGIDTKIYIGIRVKLENCL